MKADSRFFLFFGSPGAGKGTLAQMCVERLGWAQLSTGDLFRKHIAEGTSIGKHIDFVIKSGKLVDDTVVMNMVSEWMQEKISEVDAIIFDGFPRTLPQAQLFTDLIKEKFSQSSLRVFELEVESELVIKRLSSRRVCSAKNCQTVFSVSPDSERQAAVPGICDRCGSKLIQRADDADETIRTRLTVYHKHANELLNFFKKSGVQIEKLDGYKPLDEVFENFVALVSE